MTNTKEAIELMQGLMAKSNMNKAVLADLASFLLTVVWRRNLTSNESARLLVNTLSEKVGDDAIIQSEFIGAEWMMRLEVKLERLAEETAEIITTFYPPTLTDEKAMVPTKEVVAKVLLEFPFVHALYYMTFAVKDQAHAAKGVN